MIRRTDRRCGLAEERLGQAPDLAIMGVATTDVRHMPFVTDRSG
jgi:hypothetical protein